MSYYKVRFPDVGAGAVRIHAIVEGETEDDVRELADGHEHFNGYDAWSGDVFETGISNRLSLDKRVKNVTDPNTAILSDGTIVRRDLENQGVYEQKPEA